MDRWGRLWPCLLSLWPGLPRLWRQGSWLGLAQALGFAFLLQLTVFTSLIWPESVGPVSQAVVWFCVLGFWLLFARLSFSQAVIAFGGGFSSVDREHLFQAAQREYLRGNWHQAERLLTQQLDLDAGDVDARLFLAMLFRHVGRLTAAKEQLDHLVESHGSDKWTFEVFRERLSLNRLVRQARDASQDAGDHEEVASEAA